MPKRVQMHRRKGGWRAENPEAVIVARPSRWGNPIEVGSPGVPDRAAAVKAFSETIPHWVDAIRSELRGKDLACWCPLDQPCHADVLLEIANSTQEPNDA